MSIRSVLEPLTVKVPRRLHDAMQVVGSCAFVVSYLQLEQAESAKQWPSRSVAGSYPKNVFKGRMCSQTFDQTALKSLITASSPQLIKA